MSERTQLNFDDSRPDRTSRMENIQQNRLPISLLLDGLQDAQNIGGLFRTADAARIQEIILYKCPIDFKQKNFKKTARSTLNYTAHRIIEDEAILREYAVNHTLISLEHTSDSKLLTDTQFDTPITLVLGNEKRGVSQLLLDLSVQAVHIPMLGVQTSLNVCVAGSIAIFEMVRRL